MIVVSQSSDRKGCVATGADSGSLLSQILAKKIEEKSLFNIFFAKSRQYCQMTLPKCSFILTRIKCDVLTSLRRDANGLGYVVRCDAKHVTFARRRFGVTLQQLLCGHRKGALCRCRRDKV
jgi:hypothetical protein